MEIREQIESDLRSVASSSLPSNIKKAMDQVIFRLRTQNSKVEITEINDPFVFLFEEISKDKRLINESISILSTIRQLLEIGALEGNACKAIFSTINQLIQTAPETFLLKILQISLASFTSPSKNLESRIIASKWVFQMAINTQYQIIPNIATATSFQLIDVVFDKAMGNTNDDPKKNSQTKPQKSNSDFDNTAEMLIDKNDDQNSDNEVQIAAEQEILPTTKIDPEDWSISYIFSLVNDLLFIINKMEPVMFQNTFSPSSSFPLILLKYIFDEHFRFLSLFQPQFKASTDLLFRYISSQESSDQMKFAIFIPHLMVNLIEDKKDEIIEWFTKVVSYSEKNFSLLNSIAVTIASNQSIQFDIIPTETMLRIVALSSKVFLTHFKGNLSESIIIFKNEKKRQSPFSLTWYDPFEMSMSKILVSCVLISYYMILQCLHHSNHFVNVFNYFDGIWQRVIQATQDPITLGTSLKIARQCVRISIKQKQNDPAQRIFSTLCGFAVPTSAAFPLIAKGVIALHSIIRLLQQLKGQLVQYWPLIFETISRCHHTAAHKRSAADLQALKLIQPSLVTFSVELPDDLFIVLFKVILTLSEREENEFFERKGTVPNFWPFKTLSYIFDLRISDQNDIQFSSFSSTESMVSETIHPAESDPKTITWLETTYFDHLGNTLQCESSEYRTQACTSLFEISRDVINSKRSTKVCRQIIFDFIFQAANSLHRDVSIAAFNGLLTFLAGGTASNIGDGWSMIVTILKVVWATTFSENIQNGFRVLTFICSDCLMYLSTSDIELCLSTISAYINQGEDINIALGTIGLLWNVGSSLSLLPSDPTNKDSCWKTLFKTLQNNFDDKRQNVRESSLQTFFSLVNTFYSQFSSSLRQYVLDNVISPLVSVIANSDSSLLAIQGVTQCLRSLGDCQSVVSALIDGIELIALRLDQGITAGEATRCYIPFISFEDKNLLQKVTMSFERTVRQYVSNPQKSDLQGAVSVVTDILPKIAFKLTIDEFNEWIKILKLFCTFQIDKPFLHVATHAALNVQTSLVNLNEEKVLNLFQLNSDLIDLGCQPLTSKCFEIQSHLFINNFDDKGRARCLIKFIPLYKNKLDNPSCSECFNKMLQTKISLEILLDNSEAVLDIIEIGRQNSTFRPILIELISRKMELIHDDVFPIFLSLGRQSPILFKLYFKKCCLYNKNKNENGLVFFHKTKELVRKEINDVVDLLIGEERALGSTLRQKQYKDVFELFDGLKLLDSDGKIFNDNGNKGHLLFLIDSIIKLTETKSIELRTLMQNILHLLKKPY